MNKNVSHFFRESSGENPAEGHFHKVILLHQSPYMEWEELQKKAPKCPKGWYELSKLGASCRLEFIRDFWASKLPYADGFSKYFPRFFDTVEDVGIYLFQKSYGSPFEVEMVYSLKNDSGFYRGRPPLSEEKISKIESAFPGVVFPEDYRKFLQIHDGFCKATDTGLVLSQNLIEVYEAFQAYLSGRDPLFSSSHEVINPKRLIPFYESFGLHCYQCFYADWYPEQEMGNVYYTAIEHALLDFQAKDHSGETLAFSSFLDWLLFYLKAVDEV